MPKCFSGTFKREVTERGVFAFACQHIVSPRGRTGNRTVTQMRHPFFVEGRPKRAQQSLASTLSAPRVAATSYCNAPWSHKPSLLNGRLENCKIGGCKEIRQPFANPSQPCATLFANPSPTFRQPFCQPFLQIPLQSSVSVDPK